MREKKKNFSVKETFYSSLPQLFAFIGAIVFFFAMYKFKNILAGAGKLCSILMPIIVGVILAYLIHPIVEFAEQGLTRLWTKIMPAGSKKKRSMRMPAILLSILALIGILYLLGSLVVPELYRNMSRIITMAPEQATKYYYQLKNMVSENQQLTELINRGYEMFMEFITGWMKKDMFDQVSKIISGFFGVVGAVSDFVIGLIVAIYVLLSAETFKRQFNMVLHAFFSEKTSSKIKEILQESDRIFGGFISGKIIDSLIIGVICFLGAVILRLPYAVLISVIVGVTNIIPFFGPYIGAIPSTILILLESPPKAIVFLVFVVLLQQFDGNILGPKILGESTGLSPFWVIFAILLGSGLFGFVGMIVGVPAFGVVYYLVKSYIHFRLQKKDEVAS